MSDLSDSTSSTKSTPTPKTDNREFVESGGEEALPEETKQPHLESEPSDNSLTNASPLKTNGRRMPQVAPLPSGSPPLGMRKEVVGDVKSSRKSRSKRHHHRRTRSEDFAFHPPPPPSGYYPGMTPHYHMMQPPKPHDSFGDEPASLGRGHNRIHSMPQVPSIPSPSNMMMYPAPNLSPNGAPVMVPQPHETGPMLPFPAGSPSGGGSHRKRKSQAVAMAPAPVMMMPPPGPPMYGSFEDYTEELNAPPPAPSPQSASPYSSEMFSPREELMSLTGNSPRTTRNITPPGSPAIRNKQAINTPPQHPGTPRRSPPGGAVPASALRTPGGSYRASEDVRVSFRDGYSSSGRSPYMLQAGGGVDLSDSFRLEDSIRDIHRGRKHRSPHSLRKMHMRQKSAQLFMEDTKGVRQPLAFKDVLFGLLFFIHLLGILYLGMHYSRDAIMVNATHGEKAINVWYRNVILIAALSGAFAVGVSTLTLILMTIIVKKLIQVSLILTIALSFAWGTIGIGVSPKNVVPITGIIALALSVGYAFVVWDRIPFAAANLMAGFHGVRKNAGTVLVAFAFQFLALIWSIYFTFVVIGVYDAMLSGDLTLSSHAAVFVYTMLFISYFWTYSVLYHVVQVTVAGTIGSWWFKPDSESSFCSPCVTETFLQAISYSFGSICFGSLLVEPVRLLRQLSLFIRPPQDEYAHYGFLECFSWVQQCITGCVDNLAAYFTPYAFTYIGLYRYGLLEGGHHATDLFKKRGWLPIVSDDLIPNVLLMVSLVIGGVTGCFAVSIQQLDRLDISTLGHPTIFAFGIGVLTGLVVTHVLFGLISSSVNAVIVLFAGSPVEFEKNHPKLSEELRSAWREVWPGCMDIVDVRVAQIHQHDPAATTIPIV